MRRMSAGWGPKWSKPMDVAARTQPAMKQLRADRGSCEAETPSEAGAFPFLGAKRA